MSDNFSNDLYFHVLKSTQEVKNQRKQFRHDWKIAIFGALGGSIAGFITSLIFWLLTK